MLSNPEHTKLDSPAGQPALLRIPQADKVAVSFQQMQVSLSAHKIHPGLFMGETAGGAGMARTIEKNSLLDCTWPFHGALSSLRRPELGRRVNPAAHPCQVLLLRMVYGTAAHRDHGTRQRPVK